MYEKILEAVKSHDTIIIHRHNKPDGDAMGSQIGMKYLLLENFPEKKVYIVGDSAGFYSFIAPCPMDELQDSVFENALSIILDCGSAHLISDNRYTLAKSTLRLDHHIFAGQIADEEVIDTSYESCCSMVTHFAKESGLKLNQTAARALYTGIVTDSGRFRYDSTTSRTHELCAWLMEQKFDTNEIFRQLYADSYESKKLKAQFILRVKFTEKNVAYIYTTREEFDELGLDVFTVSRGMVNTMADIRGVNIWVNFTETEKGVLCELRSADKNINPIAVKYGGGGHAKASGATVADRATAMAMLEDLNNL